MLNPKKYNSTVKKITDWGEGIYSVIFKTPSKVKFKPGQFLHLTLDDYDQSSGYWPESRVFSISSSPNTDEVEIVYSVKGLYTKRMSKELYEGRNVWLKLPYGDFIIENHILPNDKIFLIAGGTGISPFISFLRNYKEKYDITLYYGIRNKKLYIYEEIIEGLKNKIALNLIEGPMNIEDISEKISQIKDSKTFISGPITMINAYKEKLLSLGYDKNNIIIDEW